MKTLASLPGEEAAQADWFNLNGYYRQFAPYEIAPDVYKSVDVYDSEHGKGFVVNILTPRECIFINYGPEQAFDSGGWIFF